MRELTFRRESWHHKIATIGGLSSYEDSTDICDYTRHFLGGVSLLALSLILGALFAYLIGDFMGWLAACLYWGRWITPGASAGLVLLIAGLATFFLACAFAMKGADKVVQSDTFAGEAVRSFKDRVCVRVNVRESE